jgi:hypothetical protein
MKTVIKLHNVTVFILSLLVAFCGQVFAQSNDGDTIDDSIDNCTLVANEDQRDTDGDGYGNYCDPDLDNSNTVDTTDYNLLKLEFYTGDANADFNGDGQVNFADLGIMKPFQGGLPGPSALSNKSNVGFLGRGNNFGASRIIQGQGSPEDYALLKNSGFQHVRIGYKMDEKAGGAPNHTIPAGDMTLLQEEVDDCMAAGLICIVDPVHNWANNGTVDAYEDTAANRLKLQKIWEQVATHFASYPIQNVVFEILNEPHDNGGDFDNAEQITSIGLTAIRADADNANRKVIVSGDGFSTRQALLDAFNDDELPTNDANLIATFHYYDPFSFTKQGTNSPGVDAFWGTNGEYNTVATDFAAVTAANQAWAARNGVNPLTVYVGEFGVDNDAPVADRLNWLSWVVMVAESEGFSWAHWQMYKNTADAKGMGPWTPTEINNPALRTFDSNVVEALTTFYEAEGGNQFGGVAVESTNSGFTGSGYVTFPAGVFGGGVFANQTIFIPRQNTYALTFRYASDVARKINIITTDNGGVNAHTIVDEIFPATGGFNVWATHTVNALIEPGDSIIIKLVAAGEQGPNIDSISVTQ